MYFNLRSPYSWLALHDLRTEHPDLLSTLEWRPFWDPSPQSLGLLEAAGGRFIYTPMSREKHLYVLYDVRRLAQARDLRVTWPIDRAPQWEISHFAYTIAAGLGRGCDFAIAASCARWEQGRDLTDPAAIADIGADVGVDLADAAALPADPEMMADGTAMLMDAFRDGVFGVPFFVHGHEKFWGLDRLPTFVRTVRAGPSPAQPPNVPATVATGAIDDGHAGGCG